MPSESFQKFLGNAGTKKPVCLSGVAQESRLVLELWLRPVLTNLQHTLLGPGPEPCGASMTQFLGPWIFPWQRGLPTELLVVGRACPHVSWLHGHPRQGHGIGVPCVGTGSGEGMKVSLKWGEQGRQWKQHAC